MLLSKRGYVAVAAVVAAFAGARIGMPVGFWDGPG
jgi:hypothetical protein